MEAEMINYINRNGITFKLQAVNGDGEIVLQETSSLSFDDVSAYSALLDERFENIVRASAESKDDDLVNAEIDEAKMDKSY